MEKQISHSRLEQFSQWMARLVPDAISASVILTLVIAGAALALGNPASRLMDAYHQGLWMLLAFTMQMALIIVLRSALGSTPVFRTGVARLARIPGTRNQSIVLEFLIS